MAVIPIVQSQSFFSGCYVYFPWENIQVTRCDRACEWLRFSDWLELRANCTSVNKEEASTTSERKRELCEPRYLRNANSFRNGTCKEDSISTPLIMFRVSTAQPRIYMTFFLLLFIVPLFFFTHAMYRSGMISNYQLYILLDFILKV